MENKIARVSKITAVIVWIIGGIASFILAKDVVSEYGSDFGNVIKAFGIYALSFFVSGLFLYLLGEIVTLLQDIKYKITEPDTYHGKRDNGDDRFIAKKNQ